MKAELLAPAGSFEAMQAALRAGADAVYLGGQRFGARAYARNLDQEEMIEAIHQTHRHGKKLYLTVNTLLKNKELTEELYRYLAPFYEAGLDAVIVQDPGVMKFVRENFPGMHIHASTQMTVTGPEAGKLIAEAGASRIVTARELSLKEIRAIYDATHVEIESFVHGALCYCYSGQCLMSSLIGGRSGNRGRCAQPCRLPYQAFRQEGRTRRLMNDPETSYVLSPKDMCTVALIPQLLDAGIYSLKIEGRMKKPEYTAGVVEIYRKYLDRWLAGDRSGGVSEEDYQTLLDIYNRDGFHESYYQQRNGRNMMALRNEKKTITGAEVKNLRNEELFARLRQDYLDGEKQEKIKGTLSLFPDCPAILELEYQDCHVTVEGEIVQEASSRPLEEERIRTQMEKTGGTGFAFEELTVYMGERIFLPMKALNQLRRDGIAALEAAVQKPYERKAAPMKADLMKADQGPENRGLHVSVTTKEQLEAVWDVEAVKGIYADCGIFSREAFADQVKGWIEKTGAEGKDFYLLLPHMVRDRELDGRKEAFPELIAAGLRGFLIRNLESFGILRSQGLERYGIPDANLYTMNGEAQKFWRSQGVSMDTIPFELNKKELAHRVNTSSEMVIYGYIPMMVSVQCVQKNLDKCNHQHAKFIVKDRFQKEFQVVCNCEFCYNTIYNSLPLSLLQNLEELQPLAVGRYRLAFTLEDKAQTRRIVESFGAALAGENGWKDPFAGTEVTKGHFRRGVE